MDVCIRLGPSCSLPRFLNTSTVRIAPSISSYVVLYFAPEPEGF